MSEEIKSQIEANIALSDALLEAFSQFENEKSDENLASLNTLTTQRTDSLRRLFDNNQSHSLAQYPQLLNTIASQDKLLVELATKQKSMLAKAVIKQKKNTKATSAYLKG